MQEELNAKKYRCSNCGKEIEFAHLVEHLALCDDCYNKIEKEISLLLEKEAQCKKQIEEEYQNLINSYKHYEQDAEVNAYL